MCPHPIPPPPNPAVHLFLYISTSNLNSTQTQKLYSMKALLIRTSSVPLPQNSFVSPRVSPASRALSFHLETDVVLGLGSRSLSGGDLMRSVSRVEELEFPGGGIGKGRKSGGGGGGDYGSRDRSKMGAYYQDMLRSNPGDSLLLANYAKFLYEVEGNAIKAGEYYARAILANPSDGEVLSLYAKLIWETERDGERAKVYFDRALLASPGDSGVMGLYAYFMWEAEDSDDEDDDVDRRSQVLGALVEAF